MELSSLAARTRALLALASTAVLSLGAQTRDLPALKDPVRATILGIAVPGGGQFYAGRPEKGAVLLASTALTAGLAYQAATVPRVCFDFRCGPRDHAQVALLAGTAVALWSYGFVTAAQDVHTYNRRTLRLGVSPALTHRPAVTFWGALRW
jgi:hypothetical protein